MARPPDAQFTDPRIEHLYREYVRLSESVDRLAQSSFEDFKLLGSIAAVAAWPPLAEWLTDELEASRSLVLFGGFSVIMLMVAIIGTRDLLKQSLIWYLTGNLRVYERELRGLLGLEATGAFRFALDSEAWLRDRHIRIARRFQVLFLMVFIGFPVVVLAVLPPHWYAGPYLALALVVLLLYESARTILATGVSVEERVLRRGRKP